MGILEGKYLIASGPVIIEDGKHQVSPYTQFLIEKGDIQ